MNTTTTRAEHLAWCKRRALEYVDAGDLTQGFASMMSDLNKHDETRGHPATAIGLSLMLNGHLDSIIECRKFIEGFN